MYKTCSETLKKIYFNLTLPSLKFGIPTNLSLHIKELNTERTNYIDENFNLIDVSCTQGNNQFLD